MTLVIIRSVFVLLFVVNSLTNFSKAINVHRKSPISGRILHALEGLDQQKRSVRDRLGEWNDDTAGYRGAESPLDQLSLEHRVENNARTCSRGHKLSPGTSVNVNGECRECGTRCCNKKTKRIPGGHNALPGEFPWHAAIFRWEKDGWRFICGGALVSNKHVLTAAHCVSMMCHVNIRRMPKALQAYRVTIGETDINLNKTGFRNRAVEELRHVSSVGCHGSYQTTSDGINHYDVAMLELTHRTRAPIACLTQNIIHINETRHCFGIGHGRTGSEHTRFGSSVLMKVGVNVIDAGVCMARFGHEFDIGYNVHACAHTGRLGSASCKLDSGSPILCPVNPHDHCSPYVIRGVYSNIRNGGSCQSNRVSYLTNMFSLNGWTPSQWAADHIGFDLSSPNCAK